MKTGHRAAALGLLAVMTTAMLLSTPSLAPATPISFWLLPRIVATIAPGESRTGSVIFLVSEALSDVVVDVAPEIRPYVHVSPQSFSTLPRSTPIKFAVTLSAPPTALGGTHQGTIQLLDSKGTTVKPLPVTITITGPTNPGPTNEAPVADAGPDLHATVYVPIELDGAESFDPDGDRITFHWTLLQSPHGSVAVFPDATRPKPQFTPDLPGDYLFALVVNDGTVDSAPALVTVRATTGDAPPNARAGKNQSALVGAMVSLDGSRSFDPNGHPLTFGWSFAALPAGSALTGASIAFANTATPQFTPDVAGVYLVGLRVSNGPLFSDDLVEIDAATRNVAPNARAGPDQFVRGGMAVPLDGRGSSDPDGLPGPLGFDWALTARPAASALTSAAIQGSSTPTPSVTPDAEGQFLLRLTVGDGESKDADNALVVVDDTPPRLDFVSPTDGSTANTLTPTLNIIFSDAGSGVDPTSYRTTLNGVDVTASSHVTPAGATYTPGSPLPLTGNVATARIADRAGNVTSKTIHFNVSAFRAIADCGPKSGPRPLQVAFRSRGEFSGGSIVKYRWDFQGDGVFDTSDAVATDYSFIFNKAGTFTAKLEVTNNLGQVATDTCVVDVTANAPTAVANASPSNGPIPLIVNLTCVGNDADGTIAKYEWDFDGDGVFDYSSLTTGSVAHTYPTVGTFIAVCRVTDNSGLTGLARTTTTVIRPAPPGSPSVTATATPGTGNAPLMVSFNGSVVGGGTIVRWEWDFDGDGVFDFVSTTSPATSFQYTKAGIFAAALRVTDSAGLTGIDTVEVIVNLVATLSIPNGTFDPGLGQTAAVRTTISGTVPVRILIKDKLGATVRTLVNTTVRVAGTYSDVWDGRDDAGNLLPQAPYFAILEYDFSGEVRRVDLTNSTGGFRYSPSRNTLPSTFSPFKNEHLTIDFTITAGERASEIQAFIGLFNTDTRFVTLLDRVPLGVGTHTLRWDGLDANGKLAVPPPGESFLFGIFGFRLPDNALFIQSAPTLSNVTVDPNLFDPSVLRFLAGARPTATVKYDLDKMADVQLTVTNLKNGQVVRAITQVNVAAGTGRTIAWDGRADNGVLVDAGDYRLTLRAVDSTGSASLVRYALIRVFY